MRPRAIGQSRGEVKGQTGGGIKCLSVGRVGVRLEPGFSLLL